MDRQKKGIFLFFIITSTSGCSLVADSDGLLGTEPQAGSDSGTDNLAISADTGILPKTTDTSIGSDSEINEDAKQSDTGSDSSTSSGKTDKPGGIYQSVGAGIASSTSWQVSLVVGQAEPVVRMQNKSWKLQIGVGAR